MNNSWFYIDNAQRRLSPLRKPAFWESMVLSPEPSLTLEDRQTAAADAAAALLSHVQEALVAPASSVSRTSGDAAREAALVLLSQVESAGSMMTNKRISKQRSGALALAAAQALLTRAESESALRANVSNEASVDNPDSSAPAASEATAVASTPEPLNADPAPTPPVVPRLPVALESARALLENLATPRGPEDDADDTELEELREALDASDLEVGERMLHAARLSNRVPSAQMLTSYRAPSELALARISRASHAGERVKEGAPSPKTRTSGDAPKRSKLQALCTELVQTERRYHRDLTLLVHTFVRGLRVAAPELIPELTPNCDQVPTRRGART